MSTTAPTISDQQAAAHALVVNLPSAGKLTAVEATAAVAVPAEATTGILASYVGARSADLALVLIDTSMLAEAAGSTTRLKATDVLQPALEQSAAVLGAGVLGAATETDVSALFDDEDTVVFELVSDSGTAGWFLVRVRVAAASSSAASAPISDKLGRINNVEMALTVEIGHTRMSVRDILTMEPGAVIELDRAVGAPADVLLNGRLIAHGEIVVVDQDYAVRITRILDSAETA